MPIVKFLINTVIFFLLQPSDSQFSSQIMVYKDIGEEMLQHAFDGKYPTLKAFDYCKDT